VEPGTPERGRAEELVLEVQRRAFNYFWERASRQTGLVDDRANNFGRDNANVASIAATGYALAALPIAVEHGWIKRAEAAERANLTLHFVLGMPHQHGWLVHWVDGASGARVWASEYSSIDTGLLLAGALACGEFFSQDTPEILALANALYERIDWWWMLTNGGAQPDKRTLAQGWKPEIGFIPNNYDSYDESILLYLLGLGAAGKPLPAACWAATVKRLRSYDAIQSLKAGPIFIHQMPSGYYYLRDQRDALGWDYWVSSTNAMLIDARFCANHADQRKTYAEGFWGLNASDGPSGYQAYGAPDGPEDGTVSPTGAISAITFVPQLGFSAAIRLHDRLGDRLWGTYGFSNAFNLDQNYFDPDVIGIDLGMALLAIENRRSGLIWRLIANHPSTQRAYAAAGLRQTLESPPRPVILPPGELEGRP
jgi:hypothetical protein